MVKPRSYLQLFTLLALCLALGACWGARRPATLSETGGYGPPYVITGIADGAPLQCGGLAIAAQLSSWFLALDEGDGRSAVTFFGIERPDVPFAWFSFTDTASVAHFAVRTSADSLAHRFSTMGLADIYLRGIELNGWVPERESVGFILFFEYSAAGSNHSGDGSERRYGFGKAEYHCPSGTFLVMSIGRLPEQAWRKLYEVHLGSA